MNKITKSFNTLISTVLISSILLGASTTDYSVFENNSYTLNEIAHSENLTSLADVSSFKQGTVTCLILNVRKAAGTKNKIVTRLKLNDKVTVVETNKNGWSKIRTSKNITGWVSTKYLKVSTVKITPAKVNIPTTTTITSTTTKVTQVTAPTPEKTNLINDIIKKEGSIKTSEITTLKNNLNKLPLNLLKEVKNQGISVLITTKDVKSYYKYSFSGTMTGLFDPMANKIYISNKESYINKSIIHEFGHALDLILGKHNYISFSNEWSSIYKAESNTASSSYYKANAQEYFADAFNRYIQDSNSLKAKSPKTYKFIDNAIKNL